MGLSIEEVFKNVRIGVQRQSQGRQTPWETSSLTGEFYFSPTDEKWLEGAWEGVAYQNPMQSARPIKLTAQNNQYSIEYPTLTCAGELTLVQRKHSNATFRERITNGRGRCEEGGEILLEKVSNSQIVYKYFSPSVNDFVASAILNKANVSTSRKNIVP